MSGLDLAGFENRDKGSRSGGLTDGGAPARLFSFHQTSHSHHVKSKLPRRLNGLDGGASGGAYIIHNDHRRAFLPETFNSLARPMRLLRLAHQEPMYRR